jgi:small subunit ribosomal protein S20
LAHSPRGWTGARTPSALKRVRQTERRRLINQPKRSAAKTLVAKALVTSTTEGTSPEEIQEAVRSAVSALDRAAKSGAIHANAAARRKSRLMLKVNAAVEGAELVGAARVGRSTSKSAAAKQAKARIAASKASKAKGAQTAAGKARAALARSTREPSAAAEAPAAAEEPTKTTSRTRSTASTRKSTEQAAAEQPKKRATRATKKS